MRFTTSGYVPATHAGTKNEARTPCAASSDRMRGTASMGPNRPWDNATGSVTPRAIQRLSASRSNVNAHAERASFGQRGDVPPESMGVEVILAQRSRARGGNRRTRASVISKEMAAALSLVRRLEEQVARALVGKPDGVRLAVVGLIARGHLLIEDVPGVGKTTLAAALARSIGAGFQRIQFTSDMLPSDVLGVSVWEPNRSEFVWKPGPLFTNIVLADEINRTTPKTQSSLLEAMNEAQVSLDHSTYPLPRPFMVLATQNPREYEGTFPLPESQLDRFLLRVRIGYPDTADEKEVLRGTVAPKIGRAHV